MCAAYVVWIIVAAVVVVVVDLGEGIQPAARLHPCGLAVKPEPCPSER